VRYYDLFDFAQRTSVNRINRNISENRHKLKILRLVRFRLSVLVTLPKNCWPRVLGSVVICWPRVLGSVVIQLYAGECTPSVDRALNYESLSNQQQV